MQKLLLAGLLLTGLCRAELDHIHVIERSDVLDSRTFGTAGAYERIVARAYFRVDPALAANRMVRDIDYAPKGADGRVEFSADLYVLKPRDPAMGNGTALFEVSNRGNKGMLGTFNRAERSNDPRSDAEFGDKFLLDQGYTLVWLGWQWDVSPSDARLLHAYLPRAAGVMGIARAEYVPEKKVDSLYLADRTHVAYPAADPNDPGLQLTVRDNATDGRKAIPRSQWRFTDATHVALDGGFEPGRIYEIVYKSKDPAIAGLGMAGVRDLISFFKYGQNSVTLLGDQRRFIKRAIGFGTSQSGRFLRTYLYQGFNADEKGRKVFDGLWPHVAGAGRGSFNHRFAQPSRDAQPWTNLVYPTDVFPFTDLDDMDAETGLTDGLLRNAAASKTVPKIFYTNGSYEYWGRVAALVHVSSDGKRDFEIPPDARVYFVTGAQHGAGSFPPARGPARHLSDPLDYRWVLRGLLDRMNAWLRDNKEPPPSKYPLIGKDQLAAMGALNYPKIPGFALPARAHSTFRMDFGPEFRSKGIVSIDPPKIGKLFPLLLPQVDADGNEIAGIRMPDIQAPLGTYTGWNLRGPGMGAPEQMIAFTGSFFPFSRTKAERARTQDGRASLEERYTGVDDYLKKYAAAASDLSRAGYLREADIGPMTERARKEWDYWAKRP